MRTRLQHALQAIALNHAFRQGRALWSQAGQTALQAWALPPYTSQRRTELLNLYVQLQKRIQELDQQVEEQAKQRPQAFRLLTHPGVGPVTALATEVFLGDPSRFAHGKAVASYIGMIPCEHSSRKRQRLGKMAAQLDDGIGDTFVSSQVHSFAEKRGYSRSSRLRKNGILHLDSLILFRFRDSVTRGKTMAACAGEPEDHFLARRDRPRP